MLRGTCDAQTLAKAHTRAKADIKTVTRHGFNAFKCRVNTWVIDQDIHPDHLSRGDQRGDSHWQANNATLQDTRSMVDRAHAPGEATSVDRLPTIFESAMARNLQERS